MKCRPLSLPRVPVAQQLTANLLADPVTPSATALTATPEGYPSLLRRARFVQGGAHFSYVSPLPMAFPYEFPAPEDKDATLGEHQKREIEAEEAAEAELDEASRAASEQANATRRMDQIEDTLRTYEVQVPKAGESSPDPVPPQRRASSYPSARLVAFSPECHQHCLPHLAVGDAHTWLLATSGRAGPSSYSSGPMADAAGGRPSQYGEAGNDADARRAFSDWAAGRAVPLHITHDQIEADGGAGVRFFAERDGKDASHPQDKQQHRRRISTEVHQRQALADRPYGPWSLRYGGYQFGEWAGQLGDGRAMTLIESQHPDGGRWEVQLKGAGRTPYSRFGDGLATLKSSLREFLASEYMAALGIPTSRSLAVTSLPDLPVARETMTSAAIAMRLAPSWLRIGNFQIHSSKGEWESVRLLGEYVAKELLGMDDVVKSGVEDMSPATHAPPWAERVVREVALRNARTCALWQAYGFMHGVLNTDNIALLGDTIDYGPYGFMDIFDDAQICNHSDYSGRYSYRLQPTMILYAVEKLLEALAPVLGFERSMDRAPRPCELMDADEKQIQIWADHGMEVCADPIRAELKQTLLSEWSAAWLERLGVASKGAEADKAQLIDPLLEVLAGLDMTRALRFLCDFPVAQDLDAFAAAWLAHAAPGAVDDAHVSAARQWLATYGEWLKATGQSGEALVAAMKAKNPAFVLRNWVTDEAAERLEDAHDTQFVERVRRMCLHPFEAYGTERDGVDKAQAAEEARLCTVGTVLTGNLPSCSS
ncbi:uncharacterized protein MJAP1_000134 [Malassezia japonica]|uniref:Selenoprotein O n=1 Tax=Malassezia japonica TaxID=223818 RepID=A0AAF0F2F8_9BASI|nr:uncharacterized protein MJAP1_000134 [Malassezia japonica]WFD37192.1 hypothetical protein MJAP1_000134 [Malassezia japonica]